jgi:hypothetical protein
MNVLLIGGKGFLGRRLLAALNMSDIRNLRVTIGSRRPDKDMITVNLNEPADYPKLRDFDVVINCAALPSERYEPLVRYCLDHGVRMLETAADPAVILLLMQLKQQLTGSVTTSSGLFLFGIGIFPGISNLLIKQVLSGNPDAKQVLLGIQYEVMSGAGRGMCQMMTDTIASPGYWYEQGREQVSTVPFSGLSRLSFRAGPSTAIRVTLGELYTMHGLLPTGSACCYISFRPVLLNRPCYYLFNGVSRLGVMKKPALRLLYSMFYFVRGILFRSRKTDIRLLCAVTAGKTGEVTQQHIWFNDAFLAAGLFTAVLVRQLQANHDQGGCHAVEDLYSLDNILPQMAALSNDALQYECAPALTSHPQPAPARSPYP